MVSVRELLLEAKEVGSEGANCAEILCVPAPNPLVVKLAWPKLRVTTASVVEPSRKVTEPVGVALEELTTAANVIGSPASLGFAEAVRAVLVANSTVAIFVTKALPLPFVV